MKKILLILVFVSLFGLSANAQIRFGAKAGVGASSIGEKKISTWNTKDVTTFYVGPTLEMMIHEKVGIEGSLLYSEKGIKFENEQKITTSYLELPISIKGLIPLSEKFGIYGSAGPYINVKVSSDETFDAIKSQLKASAQGLTSAQGFNYSNTFKLERTTAWD